MSENKNNIRLRFAPSPTGYLHLGNFRTALFGYLTAKSLKGKFLLRLEDTDQKREIVGSLDKLLDILDWAGIKFDEGPHIAAQSGPYIQSQRLDIYNEYVTELLAKGAAYHCFCEEDRLSQMRAAQEANKQAPRYDRLCRNLTPAEIKARLEGGDKFVIRQKMPLVGEIKVYDEIRGEIKFNLSDLDDQVLIKSNGVPTYHFASVVDDHLMKITHVSRGAEWLPSFPKNILLYQAFDWEPPKFIHLPLILNKTGGKLSKRQGDVFLEQYRDKGYLPEAIINFCALLGWHGKDDQELYQLSELEQVFDFKNIGSSPAIFDEEKLDYYNAYYIRQKTLEELTDLCLPYFLEQGIATNNITQLSSFVALAQDRMKKLSDVIELTAFLFVTTKYEKELLIWKGLTLAEIKINLELLKSELEKIESTNWNKDNLETTILNWIRKESKKNGDILWPLRVSLSGLKNSPGPFEIASALGKEESLKRLKIAINMI